MRHLKVLITGVCAATMLAVMTPAPASAIFFGFYKISNNGNPNVASQLSVDVTDGGAGTVNFKFYNNVGTASSLTDIYFDDGTLLEISNINDSGDGVDFSDPATPGNLPGGNNEDPDFITTRHFSLDTNAPVMANGVNTASEWVNVNFSLQGGQLYNDTIAALGNGSLRIGLHVQAIGNPGGSDSFVNTVVPEPFSLALLGVGLTMLGGAQYARRRRNR